jgi:hypothetical protein
MVLLWPPLHIVAVKYFGFSSWRLFGWGMYASPSPDDGSSLRVVLLSPVSAADPDIKQVFAELLRENESDEDESNCINLFTQNSGLKLSRLPLNGVCESEENARNLDYFLQFSSTTHLAHLLQGAMRHGAYTPQASLVYLTHQRSNLRQQQLYFESEVYRVQGESVHYLGRISSAG